MWRRSGDRLGFARLFARRDRRESLYQMARRQVPRVQAGADPRVGSDLLDRRFGRPSPAPLDAEREQKEIVEYVVQRIR
jgi:predicted kinase